MFCGFLRKFSILITKKMHQYLFKWDSFPNCRKKYNLIQIDERTCFEKIWASVYCTTDFWPVFGDIHSQLAPMKTQKFVSFIRRWEMLEISMAANLVLTNLLTCRNLRRNYNIFLSKCIKFFFDLGKFSVIVVKGKFIDSGYFSSFAIQTPSFL